MIQFKFTKCPCCNHANPIPFSRKISMGLWSEEKCSSCQCILRCNRIVATFMHLFNWVLPIFGLISGLEIFKFFFGSEFGLSLKYFVIGGFLGLITSGILALWLFVLLVPLVLVEDSKDA